MYSVRVTIKKWDLWMIHWMHRPAVFSFSTLLTSISWVYDTRRLCFFGGYRTTVSVTFIVLSRSPIFILIIYNLHYFSSVCTSYGCPQLVLVLRILFAQDLDSDSSKDQCHNKSELCSKHKQYLWNELIMTNIYDFNYITELSSNKK